MRNTFKNYNSISLEVSVAVQKENGTVVEKDDPNHNDRSYKIHVTKNGWLINRNSKYVKVTLITAEQYLRDQLSKGRKTDMLEDIKDNLKAKHIKTKAIYKQIMRGQEI